MVKNRFNKREYLSLIGASLVLAIVSSFRGWGYGSFSFSVGFANLFRAFLLSLILFSIYLLAVKTVARLHGAKATFRIWGVERFWFSKDFKVENLSFFGYRFRSIKMGVILPLFISIITNGIGKIATIGYTEVTEVSSQRAGKRFRDLADFETARIHLAGPIVCLLILILLSPFGEYSNIVELAKLIVIYSLIPLSKLDGYKIFAGSFPLYLFSLIFIIASLLLVNILPTTATLLLGLLTGIVIILIYLYKVD